MTRKPDPTPAIWDDRDLEGRVHPHTGEWWPIRLYELTDGEIPDYLDNLTVLAFDPGGTTGWSMMTLSYAALVDHRRPAESAVRIWRHGQIDCGADSGAAEDRRAGGAHTEEWGGYRAARLIEHATGYPYSTVVVCEGFDLSKETLGKTKHAVLSPVRMQSKIEQAVWQGQRATFVQQSRTAKGMVGDDKLERWDFWRGGARGVHRHAQDADRHALAFLRRAKAQPELRLAAWPIIAEHRNRQL